MAKNKTTPKEPATTKPAKVYSTKDIQPVKEPKQRKLTDAIFEKICRELETTYEGLRTICSRHGTSSSSFFDRCDDFPDKAERYTRARQRQATYLADLIHEVSFNRSEDHTAFTGANVVQRDKMISDNLKWTAARLMPSRYGEKIDLTTKGDKIEQVAIFQIPDNNRDK